MFRFICSVLTAGLTAISAIAAPATSKTTRLLSPNGKIAVELLTGSDQVSYTVFKDGKAVYEMKDIRLVTGGETFPNKSAKVGKTQFRTERIQPVVPLKFSTIDTEYNETEISLGKGVSMRLRMMNDCVAYRFVMDRKGDVEVYDDHFVFVPADGFTAHYQTARSFNTSSEEPGRHAAAHRRKRPGRLSAPVPDHGRHGDSPHLSEVAAELGASRRPERENP